MKPESRSNFIYYFSIIYLVHLATLFYLICDLLLNLFGNHSEEWRSYTAMNYSILLFISGIFGLMSVSGLFDMIKTFRKKSINLEFNKARGIIIVSVLVFSAFVWSITEPIGIEMTGNDYTKVELLGEKDTVTTDGNLRYLGKTRNYIFIWNKKERKADIYKAEDFRKISFGRTDSP